MENNPTQWSPDTKDYDYFIKSPSVYPQLTEDFYNPQFRGFGALGSEHDAYDNMLRDARAREIRAGVIIPTKDSAGKLGFAKDPSTTREKAAAGFERVMESSSAIGWGERNPMSAIEQYRQLTTGNVKDFATASEVESFSLQGFQDYWTSFMDMMPFTSKGSAEASDLMDKFFKTEEADYTPEKKLTALKKLTNENPAIQDFAEAYGVDLTAVALNSKSSMALPFVVENALQDALIQQRYQTYENAELGGFTRLRWNLAEMVQDPSFLRDITITTAATAGLATVELAAARAGMAGFSAGTKVSQAAAKLLKATGPMVGMVEGPAFLALRAALPRLGTVGARALAIGAEGFTVGSITAAKMQEYDYDRRDLMYNDLDGKPFSPNVAEIAMGGLYGGGLSILAMGGLRTLLGAPGDISAAMQVKRFGGNFSDMTRAYGREWSNSLDTWASTADGLTVWGNELSQGRGIYFGDWLDRVIKRSGIDDRNFTNVFAGKSRVWGRVDPIMAARLNMDMDTVGKIIDEFEAVTGVAGEAAMRGAAGGEVAGVFRVLTDAETLRKSNLNADEVVNILKELKGKLRDLPEVPTPAGALLGKPKDLSYKGTAKAALRSVNLLTLDKALNRRGSNILEARDALLEARRNTVGIDPAKLDIDALNDDDYRALTAGVHFVLGNKIEGQLAATAKFSLDYDPRVFGGPELTEAEVGDIKTSLADKLSDKDEFILTDGNAAVKVNKKTGEVTPLKRELVGDPTGKVEIVVEGRGKLMDLAGDDVVSLEKIAADLNEIKTKVEELFKQKTKEELKETAKKNGAEPEEAEKLLLDLSKGLEPDPKNLKKVFGLSTQHASAAYLLFRAMGYNPEDAVLKLSRGRETRVNRKGNKVIDPYIGETENARIFWNDVGGAANAMIRAVSSRSDLGTAIHEMGHFASLMAFGRGTYDPENLRRMGISEELERKFLDWAGVKTVDKDGNKLTGEQITEQLTSVNVQEKLANAWNVYMRNILTNKSYKGKTEVHRLLNKIGDYVANIGEALKSSQTAEAALAGDVIGKAAEEVFDVLLARSNANIDDLFTFANRRLFAGLSPELRKQVGIEILGEARYNTWLAKGEKDAAKARRNLEVKAAAAAIPTLSHTEMHGVLKGTLGRSATSVKVKKLAEKLAGETPKLADESDADYLARMKDKLQEQVDSINDYIELTATFNTSAFEKGGIAGLAESTVAATAWKTLPRVVAEEDPYVAGRLRAIGSKLLEQYVNDADMDNVLYLRRKVTWDVDDKGEITLRHGVMPVTREQAQAELQRRAELKKPRAEGIEKVKKTTAKKKRIPAAVAKTIETLIAEGKIEEAKAVLAAVPEASRRVKKLVEDKKAETPKEKKAKAKEVAEADKAIAAVEKEVAEVVATVDTVAAEAAAAGDRAVATEVATAVKELAEERRAETVRTIPEAAVASKYKNAKEMIHKGGFLEKLMRSTGKKESTVKHILSVPEIPWSSIKNAAYAYIREAPDGLYPQAGFDVTPAGKDANGVVVRDQGGWFYRIPDGMSTSRVGEKKRLSANVAFNKDMLDKLDAFFVSRLDKESKTGLGYYKTPQSSADWGQRHDPITMYFGRDLTDEEQNILVGILSPHVRESDTGLPGKELSKGISYLDDPTDASIAALVERAKLIDPELATALEREALAGYVNRSELRARSDGGYRLSAGEVLAYEMILDEIVAAGFGPATTPKISDSVDSVTLIDTNGVVLETPTATEAIAAVAADAARTVEAASVERITTIAAVDSIEAVARVAPSEPATVRNVINVERPRVTAENTVARLEASAEAVLAAAPPAKAAAATQLLDTVDLTATQQLDTVGKKLSEILEDASEEDVLALIKARLATGSTIIGQLQTAMKTLGMNSVTLKNMFDITEDDIQQYIDARSRLAKMEQVHENKPEVVKALDKLRNSPSQEVVDELLATLQQYRIALSPEARTRLQGYARVAEAEGSIGLFVDYKQSLDFLVARQKEYDTIMAKSADARTPTEKAVITEYEKNKARVDLGPLHKVSDLQAAEEKVHYRTRQREDREARLLASSGESEIKDTAARELANTLATPLGMTSDEVKNILLDITTEFTVKERGSLVADAALILASDSKITPEMLKKQTDAYIRAEAKKLRDMIAATGGKVRPSDAVLRNHMRRMNNMPSIAPEKVEELVGIFNKQLTASRKTNTNFRKIAEHPTILQYGYYAGGDVMSLLSSVDLLLKNKEKMALLAADDVRLLREKRAEKMALADRAKSDKTRTRLSREISEIENDIVAMSTPEKYMSLVTAALEKGTELPSGMKKAIAARAKTLMKTAGRDTAGTTKVTEGMEFVSSAGAEARQLSRDAKIMANEQAELQSDAALFRVVIDDLRSETGSFLRDAKSGARETTADILEAMRLVVSSEVGIEKPTGSFLEAINGVLLNNGKPTTTAEKLKTTLKRVDSLMEEMTSISGIEDSLISQVVMSRFGTLRSDGKSKAAYIKRIAELLVGNEKTEALSQTEAVKEVPSRPGKTPVKIATDDNKTVVSVDKSFAQTADMFRSIYEAHKVYEETGEVAVGATDLSVVYNAIDSAVAKDVFVGKIKNAYELAKRLSETVQNPEYVGLLKDMLATQAEQLKSISVFMAIRRESRSKGAYHNDLKALTLDFIPGRGDGQLVEEVLVHELIHAATFNYLQTKLDSLGIDHYLEGQKYIDEMRRAIVVLREQSSLEDEAEASKLLVIAELIEQYVDWASRVSESEGLSFDRFVMGTLPEDGLKVKTYFAYSARNLDEFMAMPLTNPNVREAFKGFGLSALNDVPLEMGSRALRAIAATRQVALNTDDAKTLADIQFANSLIGIIASAASEESMPSLFKFTDIPTASLDDDMFFRYDPGSRTVYPAQAVRSPTRRSFAQGILDPDIETKARADYKAAMGRLLDYSQKRMEWELRSRIETEGMAGKDVAADEARLQDLITSADERQRALKAMGLHEEVEPRDLQALTDIISGNGVLQTSNVPEAMKMIKIRPASPAAKAERPSNYRDMNNEQRAQFLLDTVLPRIQEVIGRRDETAGIFSVFSDSTVGRAAFNRLIGGAVEYANVADSHSLYLQFLAKFFDPMMDLRNTELDGTYKMPSVDRLNAEVSSILVTSGLASVQEKIHARVGSQADMDEINDLAWKHLASKETLPETAKNRDLILETIDAVNKVNKQAHDVLAKYGNLRVDADPAGYGTVRKAGYLAHQDRKGFVNALYKFMYRRALEDHDNGRISAIAAEALGWLNMRRNDATEDIVSVSIPADSPLMKLFKDLEPDKDLDWSVARKVLEDAVTKLSKEEQATLRGSLGSTKDYKESYIKLHPYRDDTYSVIRQGAEIAANRYMGIGQVGDAKTIKPRGEAKGGGYKYAEERIMTHQELASDPELSKYFDKNVMELSSALLRNQVLEAMSTKMMTEFFGSETRVSVLDLIEMLRQAGEEEGGTTTMSMKEKLAVDRGYERVKTVWEDFIGKLPSGKDSVDPWYLDFLKASRAAVLTVGGVRAATSSVPELNRAIVASDHHRGMLSQIVGNLLRAVKYGLPYSGATQRNRLYQAATAYQWLRNMSTDVILARSEMMPDNPFHNLSFGGRRGFLSGFMNAWTGIKNANSVETSNFRKMLNYLGLPASVLGKPLAWINMVTTAIHIENAQRNLSENVGAFRRMAEAVKTVNPSNLQEFERLAAQCGLGGKEALDLQTAGILRPEVIDVMEAMAKDSSTRTDGLMDIRKMYEWGLNQKVFTPEQVSEAINAMQTYVGMTIRHTNAEPTLLDKRVAQSAFAEASVVFMQFLLSHSIQEVGRRRRYSTVNYSRHLVGLILMEAAVGATHKHVWGSDRDRKRGTTEDVIRTATNLPLLGSYQYLGALLRQSAFSLYNNMSDENTFQEKFHVPGLMDSPASNTPRRMMNGTAWGMGILKDLMEVSQ